MGPLFCRMQLESRVSHCMDVWVIQRCGVHDLEYFRPHERGLFYPLKIGLFEFEHDTKIREHLTPKYLVWADHPSFHI